MPNNIIVDAATLIEDGDVIIVEMGAPGPRGAPGQLMIITSGTPSSLVGQNGQFAYDPATFTVYGPKASGTWPAGQTIRGADGAKGDPGGILSGSGAPDNSLGEDGEFYIDPTAFLMYGPKASGVWPAGVSYKGASGSGTGDMLGSENLTDLADRAAALANIGGAPTTAIVGLLGNTSGWALGTNTDVFLPASSYSAGTLTGGKLAATGFHAKQSYTQTAEPADANTGSPLRLELNAILNDTNAPFGPSSASTLFGPRAVANIEGVTQIGADQTTFGFTPIGFGDMLFVRNVVGANRKIVPGWVFMSARITYADTNTVTLGGNDIEAGTASFVDSQTFLTAHSGTMNGTTNSYNGIGFLSMPFVQGNSHLSTLTAFKVNDVNKYLGTPGTALNYSGIISGADTGAGVVDVQYGLHVEHLTQAARSIGISNASATVEPALATSITAVGNTLPISATVLAVTSGTNLMALTSTPTIAAGLDGQRLKVINVGTNSFGLQDESALTGSGLLIAPTAGHVFLRQYDSLDLVYSSAAGKWQKASRSDPHSTLGGRIQAWDGNAGHGMVTIDATFAGVALAGVGVFASATDTRTVIGMTSTAGVGALTWGPGGNTNPDASLTYAGSAAVTALGTFTFTNAVLNGTLTGTAVDAITAASAISTLGNWRTQPNLGLRAAVGNHLTAPAKIAIIADSEEELESAFNTFVADFMARYPGLEPHVPSASYGGSYAPGSLFHWTNAIAIGTTSGSAAITSSGLFDALMIGGSINGTGIPAATTIVAVADASHATMSANATATGSPNASIVAVHGPTGEAHVVTSGATTVSANESCDRFRLYYLPGTATFDVAIDAVTVATGVSTAANVQTATVTTTATNGPNITITSAALFDKNMIGSTITGTGIPAGARIIAVADTSHATLSVGATASGTVTATITRKWWTSDQLLFGQHSVTVTGNTGTTVITNSFFYEGNYESGIQVAGLGHSGWATADFLALSGGSATTPVGTPNSDLQTYLGLEDFDAVIFATVINDGSTAAYNTAMGSLLTATRTTLPNATFALFTPEPGAAHSWMTGVPAVARALAGSHSTLHADMSSIAYDHSGQSGGSPDLPYQLTTDGIHYLTTGRELASQLLIDTLDPGPRRTEWWAFTDVSGGVLAPYSRIGGGGQTGIGVYANAQQTMPAAWVGNIRLAGLNGLFAGNDGTGLPTNYFVAGTNGWYLNSGRIYGSVLPTTSTDLVSRGYLDAGYRRPVQARTIGVVGATYANGTAGVGATLTGTGNGALPAIDGVTLSTASGNNRLLVANQSSTFQNGIYDLTQLGDGSHPFILTRSTSFDEAAEMVAGAGVFVAAGTVYGGTDWFLTAPVTTVGTTAVTFTAKTLGAGGLTGAQIAGSPILAWASSYGATADVSMWRSAAGVITYTGRLIGFAKPSAATEVVPRSYLDDGYRRPVNARTTASLTSLASSYSNGTAGVGATITNSSNGALPAIDGVTLTTTTGSNRLLVANQSVQCTVTKTNGSAAIGSAGLFTAGMVGQTITGTGIPAATTVLTFTDASHVTMSANATDGSSVTATIQAAYMNGIYNLTQLGDAGTPFILTRSDSFDEVTELKPGAGVLVVAGTIYGGTDWFLSSTVTTMGTDAITLSPKSLGAGGVQGSQLLGATQFGFAANSTSAPDFSWLRTGVGAASMTGQMTVKTGLTFSAGANLAFATTGAGTQLGTGATQLLGFYGATAVVQPAGTADVLASLVTLGLRAASSNPPLNLGTGAVTAGAATFSGNVALGDAITDTIGVYGVTPIAQRAGAAQAAVATTAPAGGTGATAGAYDTSAHRDTMITTVNSCVTLLNELRAWAVAQGFIKGSA